MSDRLKKLKDQFVTLVEGQMNNLECIDAKEMGEVIDIIKDLSETMYYCKVVETMNDNSTEVNMHYVSEYIPETQVNNSYRDRMYYSKRSDLEGKSPLARKMYMEATDSAAKSKELEHYMSELSADINEMIDGMDATEKQVVKQKMSILASKI